MKATRVLSIATLLIATLGPAALADRAPAGPDFLGRSPKRHIPASLAASDGTRPIAPLDAVVFEHGKASLIPSAITQVDTTARWLRSHPGYNIVLVGHASMLGEPGFNEDLATRRVDLVRSHLLGWGVASDRIIMLVNGELDASDPENPGDRRVVMYATRDRAKDVAQAAIKYTNAMSAVWTERRTLWTLNNDRIGLAQGKSPEGEIVSRR